MSRPITWQNVNGPSLAPAGAALNAAQSSFNGGFDQLQNILRQRELTEAANAGVLQENSKQAFLDTLHSARTPEELAALQASGKLDEMRGGLSAQSRAAVRGAEEGRLTALRQSAVATNNFDDMVRTREEAPKINEVRSLIAQNKFADAGVLLDQYQLRDEAPLYSSLSATQRALVDQARTDKANARADRLSVLKLGEAERGEVEAVRASEEAASVRDLTNQVAVMAQAHRQEGAFKPDLKAAIAEAIRTGKPVKDFTPLSDTDAADKALDAIAKTGKFSARLLEAQRGNIRGAFATNGLNPLVGSDAAKRDVAAAEEEVAFDESDKNNWYAPGSPNARRNYEELSKDIPALIDKTTGVDSEEDVGPLQDLITELGTVGLEVEKGVFVSPSANDVRAAIRGAEGGWFRDAKRAENVREKLLEMTKKSVFKQMIKEGEQSTDYRRQQAIKKILSKEK